MAGNPLVPVVAGAGGSLKQRFQYFSASGTFYPTQAMLDAGGVLDLDMRAGGGGMSTLNGDHPFTCGGNSKHVTKYQLTSLTPITVTVGGGGAAGSPGTAGGSTTFGTITVPGAPGGGNDSHPSMGTGNEGRAGNPSIRSPNSSWTGQVPTSGNASSVWAGSGCGGGIDSATGCSGSVLVSWWEKA